MFRTGALLLTAALALAGCGGGGQSATSDQSAKAVEEIVAADRAFNDMARDRGEQAAFAAYMDPTLGMELVPNEDPAKGTDKIKAIHTDTTVPSPLVWEPAEAFAAKSGDFGMSWGHWHVTSKSGGALTGKYMTVWHKDANGDWKGLMDTGVPDGPTQPAPVPGSNLAPGAVPPVTNNLSPTAPPPANPSHLAPPEVTPSTVPQDGEAPPPSPMPAPHTSPNNPQ